jgi:hypothetical protein
MNVEQRVRFGAAEPGKKCDECFGMGVSPLRLVEEWLREIENATGPHREILWRVFAELITDRFSFCEEHAAHVFSMTKKEMERQGARFLQ